MENFLQSIPGVVVYKDYMLITSSGESAHLATLGDVLSHMEHAGLHLSMDKYEFLTSEASFLDYKIKPGKIRAVESTPGPRNFTKLKHHFYTGQNLAQHGMALVPVLCQVPVFAMQ